MDALTAAIEAGGCRGGGKAKGSLAGRIAAVGAEGMGDGHWRVEESAVRCDHTNSYRPEVFAE